MSERKRVTTQNEIVSYLSFACHSCMALGAIISEPYPAPLSCPYLPRIRSRSNNRLHRLRCIKVSVISMSSPFTWWKFYRHFKSFGIRFCAKLHPGSFAHIEEPDTFTRFALFLFQSGFVYLLKLGYSCRIRCRGVAFRNGKWNEAVCVLCPGGFRGLWFRCFALLSVTPRHFPSFFSLSTRPVRVACKPITDTVKQWLSGKKEFGSFVAWSPSTERGEVTNLCTLLKSWSSARQGDEG